MPLKEEVHNGLLSIQNSGFTKEENGQSKHVFSQALRQIFCTAKHMEKSK